mmetsp:Transcript_6573/g.14349  ORF Transcript_6573/g.14349 Transcript_6573/m.14349 type:complete len:208 (-) Transcript_6573:327-950(-)
MCVTPPPSLTLLERGNEACAAPSTATSVPPHASTPRRAHAAVPVAKEVWTLGSARDRVVSCAQAELAKGTESDGDGMVGGGIVGGGIAAGGMAGGGVIGGGIPGGGITVGKIDCSGTIGGGKAGGGKFAEAISEGNISGAGIAGDASARSTECGKCDAISDAALLLGPMCVHRSALSSALSAPRVDCPCLAEGVTLASDFGPVSSIR